MAGKFVITQNAKKQYYFCLQASNGQAILQSEGYAAMSGCKNGIESVRKNAANEGRFEKKKAKDGRHYFVLKAGNGQVIGQSQMYKSEGSCDNGIASVQKNAGDAKVDDKS